MPKPYLFCWWCSRKLWAGKHNVAMLPDGDVKIHVHCAPAVAKEYPGVILTCGDTCECRQPKGSEEGDGG